MLLKVELFLSFCAIVASENANILKLTSNFPNARDIIQGNPTVAAGLSLVNNALLRTMVKNDLTHFQTTASNIELLSNPSMTPTTAAPSTVFVCPSYTTTNTNSATQNYAYCNFNACGGAVLSISGCGGCSGDQMLALY